MSRALAPGMAILSACAFILALVIYGPVYLWGETVPGRVDEVRRSNSSNQSCTPVIHYEVDGETYEYRSDVWSSPCTFTEGESVTLHYPTGNPSDAWPESGGGAFGLLLLLVGGALLAYKAARARFDDSDEHDAGAERPDAAVHPLHSVPTGRLVGVRGVVEAGDETLVAPLTGRACVAYEVEIRRPVFGEEGELSHRASAHLPLRLRGEDGTSAALHEGVAADVHLTPDRRGDTSEEPNERLAALLKEEGFASYAVDDPFVWSEGIVRVGDTLTVYGHLAPETDSEKSTGYRKGAKHFVVEAPKGGEVVLATDP